MLRAMSTAYPIPRQTRQAILTATSGQTVFGPCDFILFDPFDLQVWVKPVVMQTFQRLADDQFAAAPASPATAFPALFRVTLNAPRAAGDQVKIMGARIGTRTTNVTRAGVVQSQPLETELDRQVATQQELRRDVDFALSSIPVNEQGLYDDMLIARDASLAAAAAAAATAEGVAATVGARYDTRTAAAATNIPVSVKAVQIVRYGTGHPLSMAIYVPGTVSGPEAFLDAGGHYWQLDLSGPVVNAAWFGVIGDEGVTDNAARLQKAIDAAGWRGTVELPAGVIHCAAAPTNPKGVHFRGRGYVTIPSADGYRQRWDLRSDEFELIAGEEYLGAWWNVCRPGVGNIAAAKVEFLGDSTTAGTGIADPDYVIDKLVKDNLLAMGSRLNPIFINRGVGGATTEDIRTNQVPLTITNQPHLVILRPGHNDIYSRMPAGAKSAADIEAAAELVRVSLDAALASLRAAFSHQRLSIILMTPNSASLSLDGRDERYYETLSPMYRRLARKYKCCFFDTYRMWRDARDMNDPAMIGKWLDRPYAANAGGIHPLEIFNMRIADVLTRLIMPPTLARIVSPASGNASVRLSLLASWTEASGQEVWARRQGRQVQIEGSIVPGTTVTSTVIASLPADMRPLRRRWFGCPVVLDTAACNVARVYVETNGNVVLFFWPPGAPTQMHLEAINFQF